MTFLKRVTSGKRRQQESEADECKADVAQGWNGLKKNDTGRQHHQDKDQSRKGKDKTQCCLREGDQPEDGAENIENQFVNQRPFRVNAGAVSMYTFVPPCDKTGKYSTKYLCELKPGDAVVTSDHNGNVAEAIVGRNKIERRPLTMITAIHPTLNNPYTDSLDYIHTFVQNAETTNLVDAMGNEFPLTKLKRGDNILACIENPHPVSRHFGTPFREAKIFENPYFTRIP